MRLVSFELQTALGRFERIGALAHHTIVDLNAACTAYFATTQEINAARRQAAALVPPDMIAFLEGGMVGREMADKAVAYAGERLQNENLPLGPDGQRLTFSENEIRWLAPVPRPPMIRDGILLLDHYRVGMERLFKITKEDLIPQAARSMPIYWKPSRAAVAGHRQPIQWPRYSEKLDYEFELGLYIGKRGKNIPLERAWEHIAGYTVFNDLGLRDLQPAEMSLRLGPTKSKDFETSKVMGPCLVTADELPSIDNLRMTTKVNGETWFDGKLSNWAFTFAEFIAYVSREETLEVGDFFGSGPPAFSVGFEIDRWIKPGDVLACEIEGVGKLINTIVREKNSDEK
jgi:2-keto-4-pentenoate hydratase/2-oxohepta-3-ene-1,7-dioic acid hydratase in catechol pathway